MSYEFLRPFSLLLFGTTAFSVTLAIYVTSSRRDTVSKGLAGVLVGAGLWSLADGLRIASPTASEVLFWNQVTYVGAGIIVPATVLFVAAYTDHERWRQPRRFGALVAISVVMILSVFTNRWHDLWRANETVSPGSDLPVLEETLGLVHVGWVVYVLFGIIPLLYVMLANAYRTANSRLFRRQISLIVLGVTAPVVSSALYVTELTPIDLTPVGFTTFGLLVTVAIHRYRVLDLVPIARGTVVENVDAGVLVLDHDDRVVDINPQAANIIGETRDAIIGGQAIALFEEYEAIQNAIRTFDDESTTVSVDVDGEQRHYHTDFSSIHDGDDHLLGRVVIFNDVTAQVDRQEQLVEQTELLEEKNERLDEFASMVSHDLQNPLTVAKLRLEEGMATDDEDALESAGEALDRMDDMIEQLLTLARVESTPRDGEPVHLRETVNRAWGSVARDTAELSVDGTLDEIEGDPDLVLELFENLFQNAVEHGSTSNRTQSDDAIEHNDETVTVTVGQLDSADGFFVADDGTGIPEAERDRIFDHGYTTDDGSTGFGLSIVDDIADAHDWEITVTGSDAGGARFEIRTESL
jgi:PAS domain S-box-containing protein